MAANSIRELDEIDGVQDSKALSLVPRCGQFRDEVAAVLIHRHGGNSRELAMVITKLDEARQWAVTYGENLGTHVVMDKRELLGGGKGADN